MMYGTVNFNIIDTTPGAPNAFAPPEDFSGDYVQFMIERMKIDPGVRQHVACVARRLSPGKDRSVFQGRYATLAELLVEKSYRKMKKNALALKNNK